MITRNWPNRTEWAENRRTLFMDQVRSVSDAVADYATPDEIARLRQEMRSRWRALGREMKRNGINRDDVADKRRSVNRGFKLIVAGTLPVCLHDYRGAQDILAPYHARRKAAQAASEQKQIEERAELPCGDAEWESELQWRAEIVARDRDQDANLQYSVCPPAVDALFPDNLVQICTRCHRVRTQ